VLCRKRKSSKPGRASIYILHDLSRLDLKPEAAGFRVVVSGHSHRPKIEEKNGVLYFNPGSAGPRRFSLPVSVGRLRMNLRRARLKFLNWHCKYNLRKKAGF
jgi:predicted phosphodiesterase